MTGLVPVGVRQWYDDLPDEFQDPYILGLSAVGVGLAGYAAYLAARRLPAYLGKLMEPSGPVGKGYFRYEDLKVSKAAQKFPAVPNTITPAAGRNLERLVIHILDPLHERLGGIYVTSGYRHPIVNSRVGGSKDSQHITGEAIDVGSSRYGSSEALARAILAAGVPFDQIVWYHPSQSSHVHISLKAQGNRGLVSYKNASGKYVHNVRPGASAAARGEGNSGGSSWNPLTWFSGLEGVHAGGCGC